MTVAEESSAGNMRADLERTYLTPTEVAAHSSPHDDCWAVTSWLAEHGESLDPLVLTYVEELA